MADDRKCGHQYIVPAVCEECKRYIEARRAIRRKSRSRRIPPLRTCNVGHEWRGYSESCPECAAALPPRGSEESLRDFRRRLNG